ncbi:MAG: PAS domain S-box protein [Phycisphaerales bacterium]|nr:MAG: PAS domain S-box protein [Phycisphaerales bacterium]
MDLEHKAMRLDTVESGMQDREKTNTELLAEIARLRQRLAVLERKEAAVRPGEAVHSQESDHRFRAMFDNAVDGMVLADMQTWTFQEANEAFARMLGLTREEVKGLRIQDIRPAEDMPHIRKKLAEQVNRKSSLSANARMKRRDGSIFFADINSMPIWLDGRQFLLGIFRDVTDRIEAQRELEEIRTRYRGLMENMSDIIYTTDRHGTMTSISQAAKRLLGFDREAIRGTHYRQWVPEDQLPKLETARQAALNGERMIVEVVLKDKNGDEHQMEISASPIVTQGEVSGTQGIIRDITQRRQVETALRDSEAKYRDLVEGIMDVIVSLDRDGCVRWVNHVFTDVLGYESNKAVGRPLSDFVLEDGRRGVQVQFERVLEGESVRSGTVLMARDGALVHVEYSAAPVTKDGRVTGIQCVVWDVTERKRLECKLRESEERYRTLVENAGEAIATVDRGGVFRFMNATAARRLGGTPDAFVGKTMWDLFPAEIADRQMAQIRKVLETGQGCNSIALSQVLGEKRWYNTTVEPLRDSTGAVASGLVIARDIHEFKMAQEELDAYRERMIRTEQLASLGTLSATLAHELTQPLTVLRLSIQNSLKDLERTSCPARVLEDLKDSLVEVSSVTAIAERFRNFARRSAEKITTKVAVRNVAERVLDLLAESARRSKVALRTEGLDTLPEICMAEKDLEQLVFALVQNAIQAADGQKASHFQITGIRHEGYVELQFADDCGGIAAEDLPRVFEPFFTTKPPGEGTGLGLCIVQRVVADAHGQLQVKTDFGHGATFIITLPVPGD